MNKLMTGALALIFGLAATGNTAKASMLTSYWDFTQYGTVAGGNTIGDTYGNLTATVKTPATSLTSSGLAITAGTSGADTGVTLAGDQLSSFTGDFTLQMWFTSPSTVNGNTMLFGGTTSATVDGNMTGDQALFAGYSNTNPRFLRQIMGNNTVYGIAGAPPSGTAATASTLYDYTLTYIASTHTVQAYLDGVAVGGGLSTTYFNGMSSLANGFSIGGVASPAFGDQAAAANISSFLFYDGALNTTQITDIHNLGAGASSSSIVAAIPEPATLGMIGFVGVGMLFIRRRLMM